MSDELAVNIENVSKMYRLFPSKGHRLREALNPLRRTYHREFWALKDINLEIPKGHTVGILGMNGSGKSTLLQIISSVLQPTSGRVEVHGKVAALLELGAGFNPELTGRDNVILNGTIMGLNREQIMGRMEEIEGFADIGEFFDQPMKTYSSGMYMRVAFSTALYVDPEILIIDEVLGVGDAKFQEKCFRRFKGLQRAGKTILLVTHERGMVPLLCDLGVVLHQGQLVGVGEPKHVVDLYSEILGFGRIRSRDLPEAKETERITGEAANRDHHEAAVNPEAPTDPSTKEALAFLSDGSREDRCQQNPTYNKYEHRFGNGRATIIDYLIAQDGKTNPTALASGQTVEVFVRVFFGANIQNPLIGLTVKNKQGVIVYGTHSGWLGVQTPQAQEGSIHTYKFSLRLNLSYGAWFLQLAVAESQTEMCDLRSNVAHVEVMPGSPFEGLAMLDTAFQTID
jgi:ABC-type polysaccharide/polyol phosphate transport system ATPase subunit